jgi:hypothetical protein
MTYFWYSTVLSNIEASLLVYNEEQRFEFTHRITDNPFLIQIICLDERSKKKR